MWVVGRVLLDLDRGVGKAHDAGPERRNEELRIGPFVVHVLDAVLGLVVLNAEPGLLASPPLDGSAGEGLVRAGIGEVAPVELGGHARSEEHTSELQSQSNLVCRLLLEKKNNNGHQYLS